MEENIPLTLYKDNHIWLYVTNHAVDFTDHDMVCTVHAMICTVHGVICRMEQYLIRNGSAFE